MCTVPSYRPSILPIRTQCPLYQWTTLQWPFESTLLFSLPDPSGKHSRLIDTWGPSLPPPWTLPPLLPGLLPPPLLTAWRCTGPLPGRPGWTSAGWASQSHGWSRRGPGSRTAPGSRRKPCSWPRCRIRPGQATCNGYTVTSHGV